MPPRHEAALDRSFRWLGRFPLAVDVAATVRVVGSVEVDLVADDADLERWIALEARRFPAVEAARGQLRAFREIREVVRELLFARADGRPLPAPAVAAINEASAGCPSFPMVDADGNARAVELSDAPAVLFKGIVARSAIEVVGDGPRSRLGVCRAPRCGMPFIAGARRQRWCSAACGNRARVARHAARTGRSGYVVPTIVEGSAG